MADAELSDADAAGWVTRRVRLRAAHATILRAWAAREGSSPEDLAALWLEEQVDAVRGRLPTLPAAAPTEGEA